MEVDQLNLKDVDTWIATISQVVDGKGAQFSHDEFGRYLSALANVRIYNKYLNVNILQGIQFEAINRYC